MDALFKRTGSEEFPRHIKMLLQGPPKSGKTTFLSTAPNIVVADTEPHANGLMSIAHKNIPYVTVDHSDRLQQLLFVLRDDSMRAKAAEQLGMPKIETVAIDTLDALQEMLKKERLKSERRTQFQRDDWGWLKDTMKEMIQAFTSLPLNVIFTVHTKTTQDDDEKIITMPGLQGAISEEIAGMVGYSVLANRTREVRPDGTPYTKYSLKVEGDDKNPHLGNRAGGRLPEVVDPDFRILHKTVFEGMSLPESSTVQVPVEIQQTVAQNVGQPEAAPTPAPVAAPTPPATPAGPPSDDDLPVNATALQHIKKTLDEVGATYDEALVKTKTLGEARTVVRMWNAIKQDAAEGKGTPGVSPQSEMIEFLNGMGFLPEESAAQAQPEPTTSSVEPKIDGTIEQVMAYVSDDLTRIQEAYDLEASKEKPRATLINALTQKGAKVQTAVQNPPTQVPVPPVTSAPADADNSPTEEQALDTVKEVLGGEVIASGTPEEVEQQVKVRDNPESAPCQECGKDIDDLDIARLSKSRFERWLCVSDYIAETRKPRQSA